MSASDLKPGIMGPSILPPSREATQLDSTVSPPTNNKDDLGPQALELLYEFFHLLDQWDQPEER